MTASGADSRTEPPTCCDVGVGQLGLSVEDTAAAVRVLKAVADPVRLRLLGLIAASPTGEACLCDLNEAFDISQPTMSHHLKLLHEAGLLDRDKRGSWAYYQVRRSTLVGLTDLLSKFQ